MDVPHVSTGACRSQKRVLDSLGLESQVIMSCRVEKNSMLYIAVSPAFRLILCLRQGLSLTQCSPASLTVSGQQALGVCLPCSSLSPQHRVTGMCHYARHLCECIPAWVFILVHQVLYPLSHLSSPFCLFVAVSLV